MENMTKLKGAALLAASVMLSACGGGSGDSESLLYQSVNGGTSSLGYEWEEGVFPSESRFKDYCSSPRSGNDPYNENQPYADRKGTLMDEKVWLRSWINNTYLWYDEVEDIDPASIASAKDYFMALKTQEKTDVDTEKDQFHFYYDTEEYNKQSIGGVSFGYGFDFVLLQNSPPRKLLVQDVTPGTQADTAGIKRGMLITTIDGVDVENGSDVDTLNNALFPSEEGKSTTFVMESVDGATTQTFTLNSGTYEDVPVKYVSRYSVGDSEVGYLHFTTHSYPSEKALYDAFTELEGVDDLVLDLRYNSGGLLAVAAQVGYMIAGNAATANHAFYSIMFNDKYPNTDPVTGETLTPIPFVDQSLGFSSGFASGQSLPELNLSRVFVLTTSATCSASEAIMNGLEGAGIEVIQVGSTTCGKPYGFYPTDNCGTTYFAVQFSGVNDLGFGGYAEGFSPANEPSALGVSLKGCYVEDDFTHGLGDESEAMLSAALQYRQSETCPAVTASSKSNIDKIQQKSTLGNGLSLERPNARIKENMYLDKSFSVPSF